MISLVSKWFVSAASVAFVFSAHAQQWSDYKCHIVDTEGGHWVHLFEMDPQDLPAAQAALPGRFILDSFERPVAEVREVRECVSLDAPFFALKARALDDNTPK